MADFNWDDYPETGKTGADFDWGSYPEVGAKTAEAAPAPAGPGYLESGARGLAQGASLGFADEISGAAESLFTDKPYAQARDESRANFKRAEEANPMTYGAGQIGGAVGTAFVPGMQGAGLAKLAGMGAAAGLGISEADLTQGDVMGAARDTAIGAGTGLAAGAIAKGASSLIGSAGRGLQGVADDAAQNLRGPVTQGHAWNPSRVVQAPPASRIGELAKTAGKVGDWAADVPGASAVGAAKMLQSAPKATQWGAESLSKGLESIIPRMGKFAPVLQSAAQRGGNALAANHFVLQQNNPEYREMLKQAGGFGDE